MIYLIFFGTTRMQRDSLLTSSFLNLAELTSLWWQVGLCCTVAEQRERGKLKIEWR